MIQFWVKCLLSTLYCLLPTVVMSQITFERTYGDTTSWDDGWSVLQTPDGGHVIAGATFSVSTLRSKLYLIKTDSLGDTLWTRTYGGDARSDEGLSIQETTDGGFIIAGSNATVGNIDVYLLKTNATGDSLWARTFGSDSTFDIGYSVEETRDGGFIIVGRTWLVGSTTPDAFLIKTDSTGNLLWMKTYGGPLYDDGYSVLELSDGGYLFAGTSGSFSVGNDVYLVRTDSSGNTLWQRTYGGIDSDYGKSVQETSDGGYIISGYTHSFGAGDSDVYLIKTDSLGDTLWTRTYGGTNFDAGFSVQQAFDGGYIVSGYTYSFGAGGSDVYLVKTDSLGGTLWTRTYGGVLGDLSYSIQKTVDGGYVTTGTTGSFGPGRYAVYLIKTDGNGLVVGIDEGSKLEVRIPRLVLLQNQPNPFSSIGRTEIGYSLPKSGSVTLKIYDISGRLVDILVNEKQKSGVYQVQWDGKNQASGIYFYRLQVGLGQAEDFSATKKLILLR